MDKERKIMVTIEIKVNGVTKEAIDVTNVHPERLPIDFKGECPYMIEWYCGTLNKNGSEVVKEAFVTHCREDGLIVLTAKVLSKVRDIQFEEKFGKVLGG